MQLQHEELKNQNEETVRQLGHDNGILRDQVLSALNTINVAQSEVVSLKKSYGSSQEKSIQLMNELSAERAWRIRLEYDSQRENDRQSNHSEKTKQFEREIERLKSKLTQSDMKFKSLMGAKDAEIKSKSELIISLRSDIAILKEAFSNRQHELDAAKREAAEAHKLCASQSAMIEEYIMLISIHAMSS